MGAQARVSGSVFRDVCRAAEGCVYSQVVCVKCSKEEAGRAAKGSKRALRTRFSKLGLRYSNLDPAHALAMSSLTHKGRTKRPDFRAHHVKRSREQKQRNATETIQDLRVTRKRKGERKERVVQGDQWHAKSKKEKLVRALNKKVASIEALHAKLEAGEDLNDEQMEKIRTLPDILDKLEELLGSKKKRIGSLEGSKGADEAAAAGGSNYRESISGDTQSLVA